MLARHGVAAHQYQLTKQRIYRDGWDKRKRPPPSTKARGIPDHQRDSAGARAALGSESIAGVRWFTRRKEEALSALRARLSLGGEPGPASRVRRTPLFSRLGWVGWEDATDHDK